MDMAKQIRWNDLSGARRNVPKERVLDIANQKAIKRGPLVEYTLAGNSFVVSTVEEHKKEKGLLVHPVKDKKGIWNFVCGKKGCPDTRHATNNLELLLRHLIIHENTAGSVVDEGHVYLILPETALAVVETHQNCGASKVAYNFRDLMMPPNNIIPDIWRLVSLFSSDVKRIEDATERDKENSKAQTDKVLRILARKGRSTKVVPAFYTWLGEDNYQWLRGNPLEHAVANELPLVAKSLTREANAEARLWERQYAHTIYMYDAYRLGRINDPRVIIGEIANGAFCVTFNFRGFDPKEARDMEFLAKARLSRAAMGSVMYAGFDPADGHHGHVAGVGGKDGTHMICIMDISEDVLMNVKAYLLDNYPLIKELTNNGENILLALYDRDNARIRFLE